MAFSAVVFAQSDDVGKKLSITTQMFLDELKGEISFERNTQNEKKLGLKPVDMDLRWNRKHRDRMIATPDTIDGEVYISAFIRLEDDSQLSELEALGVQVQCSFDNGLITANIPVDKINEVAGISNVQRVNVASLMTPATYKAREATHVDDLLTLSNDAISSGLTNKYDGTGVVLGVIDTGIDFQHIAFKDKNGDSRIKRAYVYNGSRAQEYSNFTATSPTSDDRTADHGTHTSSTAGGSSVIVNGNTVTVTDDHANATYGGMAPGADLYLAGINGLKSTYLANAFQKICNYADEVGKPVVVSNSWGSQNGPHDGTDDFGTVVSSYFGPSHPNHVCLFAASNDAGKSKDNEGGGYYLSGSASKSNPLGAIIRSDSYTNTDAGYYYTDIIANAWARSTSVSTIACNFYVLDSKTGEVKTSVTVTPSTYGTGTSVSGLSNYYKGDIYVYRYTSGNKTQLIIKATDLTSTSIYAVTQNGEKYYKSNYTLAIQFYPTSGSSVIDVWGGDYCYYTDHLSTKGITWTDGTDDMSVSDEAMNPNVISVGAYVTSNRTTNYAGTTTDYSDEYTVGDIAPFSSYATASESVTGLQYPWISAPGARLTAGVNHYHTASTDDYSYYGSYLDKDLVVNSASNPYAAMEGTSMATPVAAGIVALWLQAAKEVDKQLTNDDVKEIMKETAIQDSYTTTGPNASHFGQGKINALAGVQYILGANASPNIKAATTELTFAGDQKQIYRQAVNVKGFNLLEDISVTLNDESGIYSVLPTTISAADAKNGVDLIITWAPIDAGTSSASVVLSSTDAEPVTINITGTAEEVVPTIVASSESLTFAGDQKQIYRQAVNVKGFNLLEDISVTLNDENGIYSVLPTTISAADAKNGVDLIITWAPIDAGTSSASIVLSSTDAEPVTINITGTAEEVVPTIVASSESLTFAGYATLSYELSCNVKGLHLEDDISVTLNDENGVYSVSPTTISKDEAAEGIDLVITWSPVEAGSQQATITLSSEGAEDVVVSLNGTAEAAIPTIFASETSLSFSSGINETDSKTLTVSGRFLAGNVTATLTDENGVFSVNPESFEVEENGTTVSVNFNASDEGNYSALLTLASEGAERVSIVLSAEASDGGTAADPYLNIAKYATIDEAGWNKKYVNNLYKYTEYTDDGEAWLTMPIYGAWSTTYYDSHPQKWIASNINSTQNTYTGKSWTASDVYQGSGEYFTSTTARGMGNGSKYATSPSTVTFYVTNITAVKLLGLNSKNTISTNNGNSYPTYLEVYECSRNADGSLTEGTTTVGKESDDTKNASVNLSIASLDASKIYKVVAGQYRGFLYEIAFQTPLQTAEPVVDATPTELSLVSRIGSTDEATFKVTATDLKEEVTVTLSDENGVFSVDKTSISAEEALGGVDVLVSFSPTTGGTYTGTITLTTKDAAPITISLTGTIAYEKGDTNMDGTVDISDVVLAVNYVLGSADASAEYGVTTYGDMNADGTVDISDVVIIVNKILGGNTQE
ncbi:MAG: S8 family serine peptidase [Bacteroidaceae bacterium]|nr:S8 family serine peptidase [Bacteroidaceae bacterium]